MEVPAGKEAVKEENNLHTGLLVAFFYDQVTFMSCCMILRSLQTKDKRDCCYTCN